MGLNAARKTLILTPICGSMTTVTHCPLKELTSSGAGKRFGFLLVPDFSLIALSSAVDPLRLANTVSAQRIVDYVTIGLTDMPVLSSDGILVVPDQTIGHADQFDTVFVVGANPIPKRGYGDVSRWLKKLAAQGVTLGGIDTGSYYLAKAGLLDGYRCTIHWEDRETLLEQFPGLLVSTRLFEIDRDRYTCSGGVSPLDLMTYLLSRAPGNRALAQQVSDLLVSHQRSPNDNQSVPMRYRYTNLPQVLLDALEIMESNIEEPLLTSEIADYLHVSRRQLERLFKEHIDLSPSRKYLEIRLSRARLSVMRTNRRIDEIAQVCGFSSTSYFIACYGDFFGQSPQAERNAIKKSGESSLN